MPMKLLKFKNQKFEKTKLNKETRECFSFGNWLMKQCSNENRARLNKIERTTGVWAIREWKGDRTATRGQVARMVIASDLAVWWKVGGGCMLVSKAKDISAIG